ncbi:DUF6314 family protein [Streptomyces scabiei]|uniref:DUF6314 family protein n=1 Tax=Streptomyces scabiei TaxID=1930 RepID=UPI0038FA9400
MRAGPHERDRGGVHGQNSFQPTERRRAAPPGDRTFVWQGVPRPAERTLRFLPGTAPGTADVRFGDGRPFHDLDLTTGRWRTDHPCAADLYRGTFEVHDENRWRTLWRVGGPAKDLLLVTDLTRERAR